MTEHKNKTGHELFAEYWKNAPVFPDPEEHARHKMACHSAFLAGIIQGLHFLEPKAYDSQGK